MNSMLPSALTSSNTNQQKELLVYFQNLEQTSDGWKVALNELTTNRLNLDESSTFFYLKIIESYIKNRYELDNDDNKYLIKQYFFNYFVSKKYDYQTFLLNKYASIINELFRIEYPSGKWSTFFQDFLSNCNDKESSMLFLRILEQINLDIGERDHIITAKEIEKSTIIKDLMRETAVNLIVQFWFNLIENYKDIDPSMICFCLQIMGKYVSWIDIGLITNDRMTSLLNLLYNNQIRTSVLDCFYGILHKGMDPVAKASFIEQFCQLQCINDLFVKEFNENEQEFVIKLAKFFNQIGVELIECFKKLKTSKSTNDHLNLLFVAIDNKFLTLCRFLSNSNLEISIQVHQFARDYIQIIKSLNKQSNNQFTVADTKIQEIIIMMTKILTKNCKYPSNYEFTDGDQLDDNEDDETEFDSYRKSCNNLLENLNLLDRVFFSQFICTTIIEPTIKSTELKKLEFNELEIALYFLKTIGDSLDNKKLIELLQILISNQIINYPHYSITVMYFEIIYKYDKQFNNQLSEFMPQILVSFLDKLKSPSILLRSKVTNLFNKFVKSNLKDKKNKKFLEFNQQLVETIEPLIRLDYYLSTKGKTFREFNLDEQQIKINRDNHLLLYETVGYLIVHNNLLEDERKFELLKQIELNTIVEHTNELTILLQNMLLNSKINELNSIDKKEYDKQMNYLCDDIRHLINLTVYSLKSMNSQIVKVNQLQKMYLEIFNQFTKLLTFNLSDDNLTNLQQSLCHYLNRLIHCFEESEILPILPILVKSLLLSQTSFTVASVSLIQEIVTLINQFVSKYKQSWLFHQNILPFLNEFFLPFVSYIFNLTNSGNLNEEDKFNLQKSYFHFIFIITINVIEIIKNQDNQVFEQILITLIQGLEIDDLTIQKYCLNILKKLVDNYDQLTKDQLTNGNSVMMNSLFKCVYTSAIPTALLILFKLADQNQIINEVISFLSSVLEVRGLIEFTEFLNQCFTQKFNYYGDKIKELCDAFLAKNLNLIKSLFKELKQQVNIL